MPTSSEYDLSNWPKEPVPEESPHHGFQGDRGALPARRFPASLTIAFSREAGSRGGSIAGRVGRKLGWPVYNQEMLEYIAQEGTFREGIVADVPPDAARWPEERLQKLIRDQRISQHPSIIDLARVILALGAQGEAVLVGRGASFILPRASTLNIRIIAPLLDRIAYMAQYLRLTVEEAGEQVRQRDSQRGEFIRDHFHRQASDIYHYDLLLNSSLLGEEICAELIAQAARAKLTTLAPAPREDIGP